VGLRACVGLCRADDTDPCLIDTDDDGVNDGNGQGSQLDLCPNEGPPNSAAGELLDGDGCIFLAQCSDTVDNDNDGVTDFSGGDASCDTADDDSEDTFDDADNDGVGDGDDLCPGTTVEQANEGVDGDGCHVDQLP